MTRFLLPTVPALAGMMMAHAAVAHAYPQTETPVRDSTVRTAPAEVAIEFDDELEPKFSSIMVRDAKGARVDDGHSRVAPNDPKRLSVGLKPLPPGSYTVLWRATDTDTHKTQGSYRFTVQP
jgi:methionine-rich copper-binding protein CopC